MKTFIKAKKIQEQIHHVEDLHKQTYHDEDTHKQIHHEVKLHEQIHDWEFLHGKIIRLTFSTFLPELYSHKNLIVLSIYLSVNLGRDT